MVLKREVASAIFLNIPGYPIRYPRSRFFVSRFMLIIFPMMVLGIFREWRRIKKLQAQYHFNLIISDNRFCARVKNVPSVLISHQLRYKLPWPIGRMEWLPEFFNYLFFKRFDRIVIPDISNELSLTGELSHRMRFLPEEKLYYGGILTDFPKSRSKTMDGIDYFIIISGPEPQRTKFENIILRQLHTLPGKAIVVLGKPERQYKIVQGNAEIYAYLDRKQISYYMQSAKLIISRPGYTTVMDMIKSGKKGIFIPTPGQVEQVYLARYFEKQGWCFYQPQHQIDLPKAIEKGTHYDGFPSAAAIPDMSINRYFDIIKSE